MDEMTKNCQISDEDLRAALKEIKTESVDCRWWSIGFNPLRGKYAEAL